MSDEKITIDPISYNHRIATVMQDYWLSAMPIVDETDALIGLISQSDLLRAITQERPLSLWT